MEGRGRLGHAKAGAAGELLRTCWITFQRAGTYSSVSVTSSPSCDRPVMPAVENLKTWFLEERAKLSAKNPVERSRALLSFGKPRRSGRAVDLTLDGEQFVDPAHGFDGESCWKS